MARSTAPLGGEGRRWRPPGTPVLTTGDTVGFWRVLEADHDARRLVLEADVRAPGRVVLTTAVEPLGETRCRLTQRTEFTPSGLLGRGYLVADLPAREVVAELDLPPPARRPARGDPLTGRPGVTTDGASAASTR